MFTWICPQCGREVPPSYTECPDCTQKAAQPPQEVPAASQPPSEYRSPQPPESQPAYAPAPPPPPASHVRVTAYQPPPPFAGSRRSLPTWLMTLLFAFAFFGLGAGIYWLVGLARGGKPTITVESPAAKPGTKTNPLQKYIEVSSVRFIENPKKQTEVRFVVTNHSPAEISGLAGNVTVWGRTRTSEEDAAGTFTFNTNLGPWESKELSAPLASKLKIYELPDWQNVSTDVQITSPGA